MDKLKKMLENPKAAALLQFVKFGLVGVSNTLISYGTEMLCYYLLFVNAKFSGLVSLLGRIGINSSSDTVKIVITTAIAFVISVTNSYYWNNRFVFRTGEKGFCDHVKTYIKTLLCYGITGLVLSPIIKVILRNMGIPYYIASLASLIITIPLNFIMNKFWAFSSKCKKTEGEDKKS